MGHGLMQITQILYKIFFTISVDSMNQVDATSEQGNNTDNGKCIGYGKMPTLKIVLTERNNLVGF